MFGDGSDGTGVRIIHTYQSAGSCVARLTVTDNKGATGTSSKTITVTAGLSPPSWIIGTWSDEFDINTFTFTVSDVVWTTSGGSISFSQMYVLADMTDTATPTSYTVTITVSYGGSTTTSVYKFVKLSATSLNYSLSTGGVTVGPIPLYLQ